MSSMATGRQELWVGDEVRWESLKPALHLGSVGSNVRAYLSFLLAYDIRVNAPHSFVCLGLPPASFISSDVEAVERERLQDG